MGGRFEADEQQTKKPSILRHDFDRKSSRVKNVHSAVAHGNLHINTRPLGI